MALHSGGARGWTAAPRAGTGGSVDLDEVADRLYGLLPGEFTAAREALAKEARAAGDAELSRGVRALRKPTVVAWAVNQASRRRPHELEELLDVGRRLRE